MASAAVLEAGPVRQRRTKPAKAQLEVVAYDRASDAHQLRVGGLGWAEIAQRVGYLDGRIASMAVNAFLQKTAVEQGQDHRRQALELELARMDALQAAYWPLAMAGDLAAATFVLRVSAHRSLILGLDRAQDDLADVHRTVDVIGGTSDDYIGALMAVVEDRASDSAR